MNRRAFIQCIGAAFTVPMVSRFLPGECSGGIDTRTVVEFRAYSRQGDVLGRGRGVLGDCSVLLQLGVHDPRKRREVEIQRVVGVCASGVVFPSAWCGECLTVTSSDTLEIHAFYGKRGTFAERAGEIEKGVPYDGYKRETA